MIFSKEKDGKVISTAIRHISAYSSRLRVNKDQSAWSGMIKGMLQFLSQNRSGITESQNQVGQLVLSILAAQDHDSSDSWTVRHWLKKYSQEASAIRQSRKELWQRFIELDLLPE